MRQTVPARTNCTDLPLLIIDDLAESQENLNFVGALYEAADESKATVLVFMKEETWANRLIQLNGGVKILPVNQVIRNPRQDVTSPFTVAPQWTGMRWTREDLEAFAEMENIHNVQIREGMTPQEVLDRHQIASRVQFHLQFGPDRSNHS